MKLFLWSLFTTIQSGVYDPSGHWCIPSSWPRDWFRGTYIVQSESHLRFGLWMLEKESLLHWDPVMKRYWMMRAWSYWSRCPRTQERSCWQNETNTLRKGGQGAREKIQFYILPIFPEARPAFSFPSYKSQWLFFLSWLSLNFYSLALKELWLISNYWANMYWDLRLMLWARDWDKLWAD